MINRWQTGTPWQGLAGAIAWLGLVAWRPSGPFDVDWAHHLLVFSSLVLVPLIAHLSVRSDDTPLVKQLSGLARLLQLPAAMLLAAAVLGFPQGKVAGGLAMPWLAVTGLFGVVGLLRAWRRRGLPWTELAVDSGLVFLPIGGIWTMLSVLGLRPLDFKPVIVLLTAIHFHYAGLVLPVMAGLAGRRHPGRLATCVAAGVVVGVPLVAAGITLRQMGGGSLLETAAAWTTALSGLGTAVLMTRLVVTGAVSCRARPFLLISAAALTGGMLLAALYGTRAWVPLSWQVIPPFSDRHIDWMRAWHGTANALGFALCGCLAWLINTDPIDSKSTRQELHFRHDGPRIEPGDKQHRVGDVPGVE